MSHSTKQSILETALDVLMKDGVGALTLERVARDAGLSKGGLLYHFESKEQLLEGLIELLMLDWDREQISVFPTGSTSQKQPSSSSLTTPEPGIAIDVHPDQQPLQGRQIASILMAARAINPTLLDPIQERYKHMQNTSQHNGIAPIHPLMSRLLTVGLWFTEALGLAPPTREQRVGLAQVIESLSKQEEHMPEPPITKISAQRENSFSTLESAPARVHNLAQQADQCIKISGKALLQKQGLQGFWQGDLTADTTLESDYILLLLWLYPPENGQWDATTQTKINKAMATILDRQLPDGGWNIYLEGPAEVNATTRAYVALRVGGYSPEHDIMQRARKRILALGGLQATNSYTKNNLSMFGLFPRKYTPSVPPELVLMP
ncbi:MAG: TetR family transcriptional regulator, partial [Nitrospirota bacterium]|nr:TetR family transcriptional regulator [Nitrospirota bacterium]